MALQPEPGADVFDDGDRPFQGIDRLGPALQTGQRSPSPQKDSPSRLGVVDGRKPRLRLRVRGKSFLDAALPSEDLRPSVGDLGLDERSLHGARDPCRFVDESGGVGNELSRPRKEDHSNETSRDVIPLLRAASRCQRFLVEGKRGLGPIPARLQIPESEGSHGDPAGVSDLAGEVDGSPEDPLGFRSVSEPPLELSQVIERLDELTFEPGALVGFKSLSVDFQGVLVLAFAYSNAGEPGEPVRRLLPQARLAGERERLLERRPRFVESTEVEKAACLVSQVLAFRRLQPQSAADRERLPVELEALAIAPEEKVDPADVSESRALPCLVSHRALELEGAPILFEGSFVVAQLVVHQAQVIERRRFELPLSDLSPDGNAAIQVRDGVVILTHLPEE